MEVVIDGIVYVPKKLEKKVEPVIVEKNYKFELHPIISNNKLTWDDAVAYASEKAKTKMEWWTDLGGGEHEEVTVNKNSIKKSYSLDNIK